MFGGELVGVASSQAGEVGRFGCGDVLELGWMIRNGKNPHWESRRLMQEEDTTNNVQHHGNRA